MPSTRHIASRSAATSAIALLACVTMVTIAGVRAPSSTSLASSETSLTDNPLGPFENVTSSWQYYQPATDFCITPDVFELPSFTPSPCSVSVGSTITSPGTPTSGTYEVRIDTPPLCSGCVRLFIDYSRIEPNSAELMYSHGHAYFRPLSFNLTYTSSPVAHSPNIKNLTNDYLIAPPGSLSSAITEQLDPHLITYAADTANFAHDDAQGPYYVGPGYYDTTGHWVDGAYVDVDLSDATEIGNPTLDQISYGAAYDSDPPACIDSVVAGSTYTDGNYLYAGCLNWAGGSTLPGISPWPGGN